MADHDTPEALKSAIERSSFAQTAVTVVVLLLPWVLLIWHLSSFWSVDPQYSYGWVTPAIAVLIAWRNWRTFKPGSGGDRSLLVGAAGCLLLIGLFWFVHDAVPDWSVINWLFGIAVVVYLFSLVAYFWAWGACGHFAFPIMFILLAVPWPQRIELIFVQALMKFVASAAAQNLLWFNIPAIATGNIIQIPGGAVGIDEACSGIRSLQAMLMTSVFLGERRYLNLGSRLILLLLGALFAFVFNLVRTILLTWVAATRGYVGFNHWHDPAGASILCVTFLCLWAVSYLFHSNPPTPIESQRPGAGVSSLFAPGSFPSESLLRSPQLPPFAMWGFLFWSLLFISGTEFWYRYHEVRNPRFLTVDWPSWAVSLRKLSISDASRRMLLYDTAKCAFWRDSSGLSWMAYFIVWNSGRTSTESARTHRPENCLQGTGALLQAELEPAQIPVENGLMRFRSYLFDMNGAPLYVYYSLWEEGNRDLYELSSGEDRSELSRLQRAWFGQRNAGQQSVEIILAGASNEQEARTALKEKLATFVRINSPEGG